MGKKPKKPQPPAAPTPAAARPKKYTIETKPAFDKAFDKLTKKNAALAEQLTAAIDALETNPRPNGVKKLKGWDQEGEDVYRNDSGDYRILYIIRDKTLIVVLVDVGDRKEVYR